MSTRKIRTFSLFHPDMANKRDSQQQNKKSPTTDNKKVNEADEAGTSTSVAPSDVYEFVSTPKHSSCSSGSGEDDKHSEKSDEKSGAESDTTNARDQLESTEESASKKRKDSELKEGSKTTGCSGNRTSRVGKIPGPASKTMQTMGNTSKSNSCATLAERKSPTPESEVTEESDQTPKTVPKLKVRNLNF